MEIFALSVAWPQAEGEPISAELTDVAGFVLDNADDMDMVKAALHAVRQGTTYRGGGGASPVFEISALSREDVAAYLIDNTQKGIVLDLDEKIDATPFPEIDELVAAIEQAEPALAEAQRMVCGNDFTDDRSLFQATPFYAALKLCRETLSDIKTAQEAML